MLPKCRFEWHIECFSGCRPKPQGNDATTDPSKPSLPIFNFNAYGPDEIQDAIEKIGVKKANMPFWPSFMLAVVAGGSIGFGALYYTNVASDEALSFAATRVIGGLVFSVGLAIVLVGALNYSPAII